MLYAGLDTQVNDCWIIVLNETGKIENKISVPVIKVKDYDSNVVDVCSTISLLKQYDQIQMLAEKILPFNQGSMASFTFGTALALLGALQNEKSISLALMLPQQWKHPIGLSSDKTLSMRLAAKWGLKASSDNQAESFLLACICYDAFQKPDNKRFLTNKAKVC